MVPIADFRNAMALMTGAVNVITTQGPAGMAGFTASAVCSVTDQPPTLLVCMNRSSFAHRLFLENRVLCVNVLSCQQEALSGLFSNRQVGMAQRFQSTPWHTLGTGAPALDGALAHFDADIVQIHEVGTHSIFLAEVRQVAAATPAAGDQGGLAYFNRRYHHLVPPTPQAGVGA